MAMIAVGVCGGIGAYKSVEVVRELQKLGHDVVVVMTRQARRFVGELTFEAITRRRVLTNQFERGANAEIEHIALASSIELLVIAPATANVIGKLANGIADDFLSSLYLAVKAPVLIAPAMNTNMLEHAAVQQNLETLARRGTYFVDPGAGYLACGWIGKGRLAEPADIVSAAESLMAPAGPLRGTTVVVSAGPTREPIDPVRFVGNRSSGRMGYAIAAAARARGAHVILVTGPTERVVPAGVHVVRVTTAAEMHSAVLEQSKNAQAVIMAAAVADYTPAEVAAQKLHKESDTLTLTMKRTPDILSELSMRRGSGDRPVLVGFAAETADVVASARRKLHQKRIDLIVANDVSRTDAGFEAETNAVTLVSAQGDEILQLQPKAAVALAIVRRVERLLEAEPVAS